MIPKPAKTPGDTGWFTHDRFGIFIHWGLYSLAARHEWMKCYEKRSNERYRKYFDHFDPDLYDPKLWAKHASEAGMKYFVITTKHHEGFCLWDTKQTDYKVTNTPYGKDVLTPMIKAFRDRGMKTGFYHSLLDWHHPDYTLDIHHPMRDDPAYRSKDSKRDMKKYRDYLFKQTEELMTGFGKIDILWYDFSIEEGAGFKGKGREEWNSEELIKLVRKHQPGIIINDRLQIPQDIKTPEQYQPAEWVRVDGKPVIWEACQTLGGSWGYHRDEQTLKTSEMLIKMLIDSVSKGGNMLLNIGPTGRGEFDHRALERLQGIGEWMKRHGRSIYGCTQAPEEFETPIDCRYTYNPEKERLYLHIFSWPFKNIDLRGIGNRFEYAQFLNDASEIRAVNDAGIIKIELPVIKPKAEVPVVEIYIKGKH